MNSNSPQTTTGILQRLRQGGGFLRDPKRSFRPSSDDAWVSSRFMKEYGMVDGAEITGRVRPGKKGYQLATVDAICGLTPAQFRARPRFDRLLAIDPRERIRLGDSGNVSMRIMEIIAPMGKGTRGMIVSPPKAGKTQILEEIANGIHASEPDTRIIVLLVDERPEEVTHFTRSVKAEVLASSNDQSLESHINLVELTMGHVRSELECGRDIVVLVDSLTRLSRAFNRHTTGTNRTMSGGLDANALETPRRFFGLARNIENGGSVTVIATALIETGSRMDDMIFEEFKGTGNSEILLDRSLADSRIFPAINLVASGTRKEELLYSHDEMRWLAVLRRRIADTDPKPAMEKMLNLIKTAPTNAELMQGVQPEW